MNADSAVFYVALVGIVAVAILFALEVRRWRGVSKLITRRQRILRVVLIVLIELLFLMVLAGPWLVARCSKLGQLIYWSGCLVMGLVIVAIALIDLRAVLRGYSALNREVFGGLRRGDGKDD